MITGSDIRNIIILLGAIQGFILSTLLFFTHKNNKLSNRLLSVLILLLALACTNLYLIESDLYEEYTFIQIFQQVFPLLIIMPIGPLIYFYVQSQLNPDFRLNKKQMWHFSTIIIDLVSRITVWVFILGLVSGVLQQEDGTLWGNFIDVYNTYSDIPRWLSLTIYILLSKQLLVRYEQNRHLIESYINTKNTWLKQFLNVFLGFQVIWLLFLIPYTIPALSGILMDTMGYYPIYIPLAILIYWLGFKGYMQAQLVMQEIYAKPSNSPQKVIISSFSLPFEEITACIQCLKKVMEEDKLYLEPSLNLAMMVKHVNLPQKTISHVLNTHLHKSFNEFVNEYRIKEVKKRMLERGNEHLTISGIAFECGFNSQATFQRTFKQFTHMSPKEFLSLQTQKSV